MTDPTGNALRAHYECRLLDPDMPAQEIRLHMGEMTSQELRTARAAIRWANSRVTTDWNWPGKTMKPEEREI